LRRIKIKSIRKSVKQFNQFILEARTTQASQQARRLGLVGDGHGDWYDKQGTLKAKTIKGELKMFTPKTGKEDTKSAEKTTSTARSGSIGTGKEDRSQGSARDAAANQEVERLKGIVQQAQARQEFDAMARKEPLTIAFDKFDDQEVGANILAAVEETASGQAYFVFPSRDADIEGLKTAYPEISESIVDDENAETIYDVLQSIYQSGYNAINVVVRKSRAQEIAKLALEQNGKLYNYVMLNIIPVDERSIREQYIAGDIFKIGSLVESNGKTGNVFRRGANHLICIDSDKNMFRTWISETKEINKNT
jgi:hypothetical protein